MLVRRERITKITFLSPLINSSSVSPTEWEAIGEVGSPVNWRSMLFTPMSSPTNVRMQKQHSRMQFKKQADRFLKGPSKRKILRAWEPQQRLPGLKGIRFTSHTSEI